MWFWLSLVAILFWSGSDFFSKLGSKPDDKYSHWKMVMAVGLFMGVHATIEIIRGTEFHVSDIITYLPVSFLYILAMVLGYVGLRYIELSVSTPICNSSGAVAAVLCFLFLHETMAPIQLVAVVLILIAIFLLSLFEKQEEDAQRLESGETVDRKYTHSFIAIFLPIMYCIIDGFGTFADAVVLEKMNEESANIAYEYTFLILGILAFIYVVLIRREKIRIPRETPKLIAGICETAGQYAYIFAIGANAVTAAPLISSYCMFSVIWARIFLKEKMTWKQYGAIALAVIGIVILGVFDA